MPKLVATGLSKDEFETVMASAGKAEEEEERRKPLLDRWTIDTYKPWCCCPYSDPETVGFVLSTAVPTGVVIMSNVFIQVAILEFANRDAGCGYRIDAEDDDPPTCKGRSHGMRPANVYNTVATAGALSVAVLLPIVGAVVENSRFRKEVALASLLLLTLMQGVQISIDRTNWFGMAILQVFAIAAYATHAVAKDAYYPELSPLQAELNAIGATASMYLFATELIFVVVVGGVGIAIGISDQNVPMARLSQGISTAALTWSLVHIYGRLLKSRPKEPLPIGEILRRGKDDLVRLYRQVRSDHPGMFVFLIGVAFGNSGMSAFATISSVFLTEVLGATGFEVSIVIATLLLVGALTSPLADKSSRFVAARYGDAVSAQVPLCCSMVYIGVATAIAPAFLNSRDDITLAYLFAVIWGVGFGQYYSLVSACYFFLVPAGQESKFSGLYSFCTNILAWLPLLMFTVMLYVTGSLLSGLWVMALFILSGGAIIASVDMQKGREDALAHSTASVDMEIELQGKNPVADGP